MGQTDRRKDKDTEGSRQRDRRTRTQRKTERGRKGR